MKTKPTIRLSARGGEQVSEFNRLRRRIFAAVLALTIVIVSGVVGYAIIGHGEHTLIDAIYMTVITLTTVGYGEIVDMSGNPGGRIFTMILLLSGAGIVAYTIPMLSALVIEGQLNNLFARRRMMRNIESLRDHHIVCGDTAATAYVADELARSGRKVVILVPTDAALELVTEIAGQDAPCLVGDPTDDDVLQTAGVTNARGVVACLAEDKDNILAVLTARRLAPGARIIASSKTSETESKLRAVGADAVVSPSRIGGLRMASELVRPTVVSFLDNMLRERRNLRVEEITVPKGARVDGRTLDWLNVNDVQGALLIAIRRTAIAEFEFKPALDTPLTEGLTLVVMCDADGRERLEKRIRERTTEQQTVVV